MLLIRLMCTHWIRFQGIYCNSNRSDRRTRAVCFAYGRNQVSDDKDCWISTKLHEMIARTNRNKFHCWETQRRQIWIGCFVFIYYCLLDFWCLSQVRPPAKKVILFCQIFELKLWIGRNNPYENDKVCSMLSLVLFVYIQIKAHISHVSHLSSYSFVLNKLCVAITQMA